MIGTTVFAACVQEPFPKDEPRFSKLKPLCTLEGKACSPEDFPDEGGLLFWMLGESGAEGVYQGALFTAEVEHSDRYGMQGRCWYQAVRSTVRKVSTELLDVTGQISSEWELMRVRQFQCPWPLPPEVYVRAGDDVLGPFEVAQQDGVARILNSGARSRLTCWRYNWAEVANEVVIPVYAEWAGAEVVRWVILPDRLAALKRQQRDARRDEELAAWYLGLVKESDETPQAIKELLSRRNTRRASALMGNLDVPDRDLQQHRLDRLSRMADVFSALLTEQPSLIETVMGGRMATLVEERLRQLSAQRVAEVESAAAPLRRELNTLRAEKALTEREIGESRERADRELAEIRAATEAQRQELEAARDHLARERQRLLHDFLALQALLKEEAAPATQPVEMPEAIAVTVPETNLTSPALLADQFDAVGGRRASVLAQVHRAVVSRPVSALIGAHAAEYLRRYATALGPATTLYQVVVEAGWTNLEPLFGSVDRQTRRFEPAAGGALDFWRRAMALAQQEAGGLQILLLRSANRSPLEVWLGRLLVAAEAPGTERIPLFHPAAVSIDDPRRECASLALPANLRVVCVLEEDPYSFPLTPHLEERLAPLRLDEPLGPAPQVSADGLVSAPWWLLREWSGPDLLKVTA